MGAIYLDHNASTPIDPAVAERMRSLIERPFGNPSSGHWASEGAKAALATARRQVAALIGAGDDEIVFLSGGSEANNGALTGAFFGQSGERRHIVISAIEHPAVTEPCRFLERLGASVTRVPVDRYGRVDPDDVAKAIRADTLLVSLMHANNEVGTIQPIAEVARIAHQRGALMHCDAAQSVGKIAARVDELGVDLLSIAGHKLYAPKGIGALYVRRGVKLEPLIHGAGHESGRRAGTESVLLAAALGKAAEVAAKTLGDDGIARLTADFWARLTAAFGERIVLNGHPELRLPNTLNVSFVGRVGADILARAPEIAASTGSACHAGSIELSPVLKAMGVAPEVGSGAIRFSLGRATTAADIKAAGEHLRRALG